MSSAREEEEEVTARMQSLEGQEEAQKEDRFEEQEGGQLPKSSTLEAYACATERNSFHLVF